MPTTDASASWRARLGSDTLRSIPLPLLLLGGVILARLALAGWWLWVDDGVVDTESGRHLQRSWDAYLAMDGGDMLTLLDRPTEYPPLLHFVGDVGAAIGGLDVESFIGAQDLVFIPALAIGCYGAGTIAYGRTAGLLAAVFALGAPMVVSVFHMFLIDTSQMAMAAVTIWAILASDRFSRTGVASLAGLAAGLGMLSKQNFPVFVAGLMAVVMVRGGWRHWRGLLAFALVAALVSATWYWSEIDRTLDLIRGSSSAVPATEAAAASNPGRWTSKSFGYYVWSTLNLSLMLPLTLMAVGGAISLSVRWLRRRGRDDVTPELVVGGLFSYFALVWIALKDPRYALPALPYMAVLGTGWIPLLRERWRVVAIAALGAVALMNVVGTVADSGAPVRISFPGAPKSGLGERELTLYAPGGWIAGKPETEGAALEVLRGAAADPNIDAVAFDPGANQSDFNHPGLDILSRVAGIPIAIPFDPEDRRQVMLINRTPAPGNPPPCAVTGRGSQIYLARGSPEVPFEQREIFCPMARR
ncbi:MAG: ArnT family glycosyltransferase [Solirubrobacteraceae bacterium]